MGGVEEGSRLLVGNLHHRGSWPPGGCVVCWRSSCKSSLEMDREFGTKAAQLGDTPNLQEGQRDLDVGKTKELESNLSAGMGNQKEDN
jgi:hypothetical protein